MTPPTKPPTGTLPREVRGGSWYIAPASFVRASFRDDNTPSNRNSGIGFRCAQRGARMTLKVTP